MRNSFSFDLKILKETDNLIKVGMLFQSLAPKYFIDLRAYRNVFLMVKKYHAKLPDEFYDCEQCYWAGNSSKKEKVRDYLKTCKQTWELHE